MLGMIIFMTEEKVAQAAITLNPDNEETILLGNLYIFKIVHHAMVQN